jgi:Ca2+-transporting ATPase
MEAPLAEEPHAATAEVVLRHLGVAPETGLARSEVARRRLAVGPNVLREAGGRTAFSIFVDQLRSIVVTILIAAAALSFFFGEWADGLAIVAVLVFNTGIGFFAEYKAVASMAALRRLGMVRARVLRDGRLGTVPASNLVPGDIVVLSGGDLVPADLRLLDVAELHVDESLLTGESVPVAKHAARLHAATPLAERANMAYRGSAVTKGTARAVVVATGMRTELGRIAELTETAEPETTPLEKRLDRLGGQLVWATLGLAVVISAAGVLAGNSLFEMTRTAVALGVAAVPEGLPIVATVALARGMWRMARRNALINRLSAVEMLGATTVILADKTGTLTENRMTAVRLALATGEVRLPLDAPPSSPLLRLALTVAALCNEAGPEAGAERHADPMELALVEAAAAAGLTRARLLARRPRIGQIGFSRRTMMMATAHAEGRRRRIYVKGAPEAVLDHCTALARGRGSVLLDEATHAAWHARNHTMTHEGLRVLALATKTDDGKGPLTYDGLTFVGLIGLVDPPRKDVPAAIAACRAAGVKVVMVTGDQPGTARRIAADIGLAEDGAAVFSARALRPGVALDAATREHLLKACVLARLTPELKLDLVSLYQGEGEVVAMTGDGVNDAPALKKADIGIAMGLRGSDVARQAADMVLRDDAFSTIIAAMHQGRVIFANIRSFVVYLLSCNLSEIVLIGLAVFAGLPLPLLPLQILYLNLVTDVFPAFALGFGEGGEGVMHRPPRDPAEPVITRHHWLGIAGFGLLIALSVLAAFLIAIEGLGLSGEEAVTVSFIGLALAQVWHVFNMRPADASVIVNEVTANPYVWMAVALCVALVGLALFLPGLADLLRLAPLDAAGWILALAASLAPYVVGQMLARFAGLSILEGAPIDRNQGRRGQTS